MGYVMCTGYCVCCGKMFMFNPSYVPSISIEKSKEPVCKTCIEVANSIKRKNSLPEFKIHPNAYEPLDEEEL